MKRRTSKTDPLRIDEVTTRLKTGSIGITMCPGKHDRRSRHGPWRRNLAADLDVVKAWGAVGVLTLIQGHEFEELNVHALRNEVRARNMASWWMPIFDLDVPDDAFMVDWRTRTGAYVRQALRDGSKVLVHCRGGVGRAGTVAAMLLIDFGVFPTTAIARVRAARPGTIETYGQEQFVLDYSGTP